MMSLAETVTRIGYIHIPGSMGTSISEACGRSLNVRYLPIHAIVGDTDGNTDDSFTIKVPKNPDSLTRHLLLSYPLIAGHLSVGQIQATYRTHIFTVITEPRKRLIKLFAHHAESELSFSDWLLERVNLQSDIVDCLSNGIPVPIGLHWSELHARAHRKPSHKTWSYNPKHVESIISPIDLIFFASDPQFVLDCLFESKLIPRKVAVDHRNRRNPNRSVDWGDLRVGFNALKRVTVNDYKFIDHIADKARIDPRFEIWDDAKVHHFLQKTAEDTHEQ
jgi:hypothetical protein